MFRADMIRPNSVRVSWRLEMIGLATAAGANITNVSWSCTNKMIVSIIQRQPECCSVVLMVITSIDLKLSELDSQAELNRARRIKLRRDHAKRLRIQQIECRIGEHDVIEDIQEIGREQNRSEE